MTQPDTTMLDEKAFEAAWQRMGWDMQNPHATDGQMRFIAAYEQARREEVVKNHVGKADRLGLLATLLFGIYGARKKDDQACWFAARDILETMDRHYPPAAPDVSKKAALHLADELRNDGIICTHEVIDVADRIVAAMEASRNGKEQG